MIYRELGKTGRRVSVIGFGGMRFRAIDDRDACAAALERALALGITYFDTATGYFKGKSEERFGEVLADQPVLISTKSSADTADGLRRDLDGALRRLRRPRVDILHIWCVMTFEEYRQRRAGGAVAAAQQARAEGLVGEVFLSTHMDGAAIAEALRDGDFAGVTLGFSAINAPYRAAGVAAAARRGLAVVCMNPLGGGVIPRNAERFAFLQGPDDRSVAEGALRYVVGAPGVSAALVGCADVAEVEAAAAAVTPFVPWTPARAAALRERLSRELDRLCTGCEYCVAGCPVRVPIPPLMMAYNQRLLGGGDAAVRRALSFEWDLKPAAADACTACGACEKVCTQKLPVIARLKHIAGLQAPPPP